MSPFGLAPASKSILLSICIHLVSKKSKVSKSTIYVSLKESDRKNNLESYLPELQCLLTIATNSGVCALTSTLSTCLMWSNNRLILSSQPANKKRKNIQNS